MTASIFAVSGKVASEGAFPVSHLFQKDSSVWCLFPDAVAMAAICSRGGPWIPYVGASESSASACFGHTHSGLDSLIGHLAVVRLERRLA